MTQLIKRLEEVKAILRQTFADEDDRLYWEEKKVELENKIKTAVNNDNYFKEMAVYDC